MCFNPYFTGSLTATIVRRAPFQGRGGVSILILLEVLLQQSIPALITIQLSSFNPYFTGSLTATCNPREIAVRHS